MSAKVSPSPGELALLLEELVKLLEDEEEDFAKIFENEMQKQPQKVETIKRTTNSRKQKAKSRRELVSEQTQESGTTDSWFQRQFNRFFEDQDEEIEN